MGRAGTSYAPLKFVWVSRCRPVDGEFSSILTPWINAPELSVTVPFKVARSTWATAVTAKASKQIRLKQIARALYVFLFVSILVFSLRFEFIRTQSALMEPTTVGLMWADDRI